MEDIGIQTTNTKKKKNINEYNYNFVINEYMNADDTQDGEHFLNPGYVSG